MMQGTLWLGGGETGSRQPLAHCLQAKVGIEQFYQAFVKEAEFARLVDSAGLYVVEAKSFNTHALKGLQKLVPEKSQQDYLDHWVAFEDYLNTLPVRYEDTHARWFGTRNFILAHKTQP
jgi:hypothetical protein